jgi:hypothetical protein
LAWVTDASFGLFFDSAVRDGQPSREIRLRCVAGPDAAQTVLLTQPGLTLPHRLGWLNEPQAEAAGGAAIQIEPTLSNG